MHDTTLHHVKGIAYIHSLKIRFSWYFNQQCKSPTPAPLEATEDMICRIRDDVVKAPDMCFALQLVFGIQALTRLGAPVLE